MSVLVALLPQSAQLQRLRTAIRDRHDIVPCDDWSDVLQRCEELPARVVVLDLFMEPTLNFDRVRRLKQRHPRLAIVMYVSPVPERLQELFEAGRAGVDVLVLAGRDDEPRRLLALVEQAEARQVTTWVRSALGDVRPLVRDAILLAVSRAHDRMSVRVLARLLAVPPRTLAQQLAAEGYPPPQRLLTWGRLIVAAQLLADDGRAADRVAALLAFPSGSAFRNTCQRYLHATPGEIRARGGGSYVLQALQRQRRAAREPLTHASARGPSRFRTAGRVPAVAL